MKGEIILALVSMATFASLETPVRAQVPVVPEFNIQEYQLTGDSLTGINTRSAQDDFKKFFNGSISNNGEPQNQPESELKKNQSISLPDTTQYLQLSQPSDNSNEALQLQLNLNGQ